MKSTTSLSLALATLWLSSSPLRAQAQNHTEKINKEFTVAGDASRQVLALYNIFGSVEVQGYAGDKVVLEVTKTIKASDGAQLETAKKEIQLGFIQRNDSIIVYTSGPHDSRPSTGNRNERRGVNSNWDNHPKYHYSLDYTLKVPAKLNVHVNTVNGGKVTIADVTGRLHAYNVNGGVSIRNAKGATDARTVNGNVDATYASSPAGPSSYHTINGKITATYPPDIAADLHFKSFHGELFTDFPKAEVLPTQVTKNKQNNGGGTQYKLTKGTAVRLGKGGPDLRFETLNGDVTIKQQSK